MIKPPDNSSLDRSADGFREVVEHYDRALLELPLPTESCFVETRFDLTHVVTCGNKNGKPVVLSLHGKFKLESLYPAVTVTALPA